MLSAVFEAARNKKANNAALEVIVSEIENVGPDGLTETQRASLTEYQSKSLIDAGVSAAFSGSTLVALKAANLSKSAFRLFGVPLALSSFFLTYTVAAHYRSANLVSKLKEENNRLGKAMNRAYFANL